MQSHTNGLVLCLVIIGYAGGVAGTAALIDLSPAAAESTLYRPNRGGYTSIGT